MKTIKFANNIIYGLVEKYRIIIITIGIFISLCMLSNDFSHGIYNFYFLVPLVYGLIIYFFENTTKRIHRLGFFFFHMIMNIKYMVLPLISSVSKYAFWRGIVPEEKYLITAIFLTIYEMIVVLCFLNFVENKKIKIRFFSLKKDIDHRYLNLKYLSYILVIIVAIILFILYPELITRFSFILNTNYMQNKSKVLSNGIYTTIIDFARFLIPLIILSICIDKNKIKQKTMYWIIPVITVLLFMLFPIGNSRWTIIIPGIVYAYMIFKKFENFPKKIIIYVCLFIVITFCIITVDKNSNPAGSSGVSKYAFFGDYMQMYFNGHKNIAISLKTSKYIENNTDVKKSELFFNDLLGSVAKISSFTNGEKSTILFYNYVYYGVEGVHDQVNPMIGQGYTYFGFFLSPILTIFFVFLLVIIDKILERNEDIFLEFICLYISIWFSRCLMLNLTILFSHFINTFYLFLMLIILNQLVYNFFSKKTCIKSDANEEK